MLYMDHAATSMGKPACVADAVAEAILTMGNPGRGVHEVSLAAARTVYQTRRKLAQFFHMTDTTESAAPERVVFTANATESLNIAIKGLLAPGDHVITTEMEHNSVLRPLYEMEQKGVALTILPCDELGRISLEEMEQSIRENTKAVVCTHASNVTGIVNDFLDFCVLCEKYNLYFILDASQTAGFLDIDMEKAKISALAFTGHKGLLGPQGIGGLCLAPGVVPRQQKSGGSGTNSFAKEQPGGLPGVLEAGTLNGCGIAGLGVAIDYITKIGLAEIRRKEWALTRAFYERVKGIPGLRVLGDISDTCAHAPILSLNIAGIDAGEIADWLAREYDIAVRAGAHCAPLMHERLHTTEQGAVRFSFSYTNTMEEVEQAAAALSEIASACRGKVIAYVGAGGKTGSIRAKAEQLAQEGKRVLIATTTKMACTDVQAYPCVWVKRQCHDNDCLNYEYIDKIKSILNNNDICAVGMLLEDEANHGKFGEVPKRLSEQLLYEADVILVEADGASHMAAKAPETWEPVLPSVLDEVAIVMGMHAIGHKVEEVCYRRERVEALLGCDGEHLLTKEDLTALMAEGYEKPIRQNYPDVRVRNIYYQKDENSI